MPKDADRDKTVVSSSSVEAWRAMLDMLEGPSSIVPRDDGSLAPSRYQTGYKGSNTVRVMVSLPSMTFRPTIRPSGATIPVPAPSVVIVTLVTVRSSPPKRTSICFSWFGLLQKKGMRLNGGTSSQRGASFCRTSTRLNELQTTLIGDCSARVRMIYVVASFCAILTLMALRRVSGSLGSWRSTSTCPLVLMLKGQDHRVL
mmetsp:Transcript_22709/g.40821  ORF Transcript_22709/g.40821 Transcript_22709/m.40821 type:complete len:201 (+) Transcript_22709:3197-3799(+)